MRVIWAANLLCQVPLGTAIEFIWQWESWQTIVKALCLCPLFLPTVNIQNATVTTFARFASESVTAR